MKLLGRRSAGSFLRGRGFAKKIDEKFQPLLTDLRDSVIIDKDMNELVRGRYAPTPSTTLTIGSLRTALYNYLYAKRKKGAFVLRVDDVGKSTDKGRSVQKLIEDLKWAGIEWDEGIESKEPNSRNSRKFGPYVQSERQDEY